MSKTGHFSHFHKTLSLTHSQNPDLIPKFTFSTDSVIYVFLIGQCKCTQNFAEVI